MNKANAMSDVIRLWTIDLGKMHIPCQAWLNILDDKEQRQVSRLRRPEDRLSCAASHALLRTALGRMIDLDPASLRFRRNDLGKPYLDMPGIPAIEFSISHTTGMAAIAISETGTVGVDVEALHPFMDFNKDLSPFGLSPNEISELARVSDPEKMRIFYDFWTSREAVAKADGRGLLISFSNILIDRNSSIADLREEITSDKYSRWNLWNDTPSDRHVLAIAWPLGGGHVIKMNETII